MALNQAFFTKQKHCPTQLFVLHHHSEAKTRDVIEIVSIYLQICKTLHFTERTWKRKKVSNWPKTSFFHQTKALPDSTFCSASLFWSENAWFYWNSEYFSFKFAKRCISQKGLVNAKMSQIDLKQAFFTKQKHCPTQLFVLHHYSEAKTRDFIEIVSILASNSQNAAFHRKDL